VCRTRLVVAGQGGILLLSALTAQAPKGGPRRVTVEGSTVRTESGVCFTAEQAHWHR